jgi:hypothetical protein
MNRGHRHPDTHAMAMVNNVIGVINYRIWSTFWRSDY